MQPRHGRHWSGVQWYSDPIAAPIYQVDDDVFSGEDFLCGLHSQKKKKKNFLPKTKFISCRLLQILLGGG